MKILHVIPSIAAVRGGPSSALIEMVRNLQEADCQVEIATTNDNGESVLDVSLNNLQNYHGVPVRFFARYSPPLHSVREFAFSVEFTHWLWQHIRDYDLIHVHAIFSYCSTVAMLIAQVKKVRYIVSTHGLLSIWSLNQSRGKKTLYLNLFERNNLNKSSLIHFTTKKEKEETLGVNNIRAKSFVLPFGVDIPMLEDMSGSNLRSQLNLPSNEFILLFLSRLHPVKGLDYLIPALAILRESCKFTFILAGSGSPEYESKIDSLINHYQIAHLTKKVGFVSGEFKNLLLCQSDLLILPSYLESFGVAILEALAAGTPALVTPGVALAPEIEQNNLGYVVPQDPTAISQAVETHLGLTDAEQKTLGQKARQFVLDNYSWDKIAQELLTVYQSILKISP